MTGKHPTGSSEQKRHIVKEGTRVEYKQVGTATQTAHGVVKKILTPKDAVGSNSADPRFLIENKVRSLFGSYLSSDF